MDAGSKQFVLFEAADALLRSWWTVVAGACLGLAAAVAVLHFTPPVYEASTQIFAAPQKIPSNYVQSTVTDDIAVRLGALREAVLSRPYLLNLISETFDLPEDAEGKEELIRVIRSRVQVFYNRSARFFEIRYRDTDPDRAAKVVNTMAQIYIKENARFRASRADETTRTLEELAGDALAELQVKEREIAEFKGKHRDQTASQLQVNLQFMRQRQAELDKILRQREVAGDRLEQLREELDEEERMAAAATAAGTGPVESSDADRLSLLRNQLESLLSKYSESHPDVVAKRRQIEELAPTIEPVETGTDLAAVTPLSPLAREIQAAERQIERFKIDEDKLRREMRRYESHVKATPMVQQELDDLTKGYDALHEKYEEYQRKVESAKGAQKIEEAQQGSRFEVIESAVPPTLPISPDPPMTYGLGLVAGLALFVGPVLIRRYLRPVLGSEAGLLAHSKVPVLVTIPCLPSPRKARMLRARRALNVGLSFVSAAILAVVVTTLGI